MPTESAPLVSVIIPAFNAARFLPDAIASIRAQNYPRLEIILVDDGSTDDTERVAGQWPDVRYIGQENEGVSRARNVGIRAAQSDVLAFLDADDLWTPDHLALLLPPLWADSRLRYVWGSSRWVRCHDDGEHLREVAIERENHPLFLVMAGLYRRAAFDEAGLFDENLRHGEDSDWLAAARQRGLPFRQLTENVCVYRRHSGGLTGGRGASLTHVMSVMRRAVQRRHTQSPAA
ncbi:MAG: glycosyltransferase family A protein [Pirellulaceae bacterium]|nr:glycosyltransferase family A protein [Pirellulaceae bacterium]